MKLAPPNENDRLYLVVCGMYMGQMLGSVEETSFGLLSITPRTEDGQPIPAAELKNYVVRDARGIPLKEWYAIAQKNYCYVSPAFNGSSAARDVVGKLLQNCFLTKSQDVKSAIKGYFNDAIEELAYDYGY